MLKFSTAVAPRSEIDLVVSRTEIVDKLQKDRNVLRLATETANLMIGKPHQTKEIQ